LAAEVLRAVDRLAGANADTPSDVAPEVLGLAQRAIGAGRGDLEPVVLQQVAQVTGDSLAQLEVDSLGVVDEEAYAIWTDLLREKHLDIGVGGGEAALDLILDRVGGLH